MKKNKKSLVVLCLFMSAFISLQSVTALASDNLIPNTFKTMAQSIYKYRYLTLTNNLDSKYKDTMINSSLINKYKSLYDKYIGKLNVYSNDKGRLAKFQQYLQLSNEKLKNIDVTIENFSFNYEKENNISVSFLEVVKLNLLSNGIESTSELAMRHTLILEKVNNIWTIVKDNYKENIIFDNSRGVLNSLNDSIVDLSGVNESNYQGIVPGTTVFNRNAAANYAQKYCFNYNPNYPNYENAGGDCANFASQCAYTGGARMCNTGNDIDSYKSWWYVNGNTSKSWRYCPTQINYMMMSNTYSVSSVNSLSRGDLIYYDWEGDGIWDHVAIVTEINNGCKVSAHTDNHRDFNWTLAGAKAYKFLHFRNAV